MIGATEKSFDNPQFVAADLARQVKNWEKHGIDLGITSNLSATRPFNATENHKPIIVPGTNIKFSTMFEAQKISDFYGISNKEDTPNFRANQGPNPLIFWVNFEDDCSILHGETATADICLALLFGYENLKSELAIHPIVFLKSKTLGQDSSIVLRNDPHEDEPPQVVQVFNRDLSQYKTATATFLRPLYG